MAAFFTSLTNQSEKAHPRTTDELFIDNKPKLTDSLTLHAHQKYRPQYRI